MYFLPWASTIYYTRLQVCILWEYFLLNGMGATKDSLFFTCLTCLNETISKTSVGKHHSKVSIIVTVIAEKDLRLLTVKGFILLLNFKLRQCIRLSFKKRITYLKFACVHLYELSAPCVCRNPHRLEEGVWSWTGVAGSCDNPVGSGNWAQVLRKSS